MPDEKPQLTSWLADTQWVVTNADSGRWARDNAADIAEKKREYLPKWNAKPASDRPSLGPQ